MKKEDPNANFAALNLGSMKGKEFYRKTTLETVPLPMNSDAFEREYVAVADRTRLTHLSSEGATIDEDNETAEASDYVNINLLQKRFQEMIKLSQHAIDDARDEAGLSPTKNKSQQQNLGRESLSRE